ncbi:colicin import membrane protein [Desulfomicrobium macestii]|uniref:Cell division and transport-associated protein TolA n=2 Tax=Desulfomicrobium TaxID=898 RepID=A0A8G2BZI3_DESNO|nr:MULTISPECIES: TonB family protein [Desulfomicrobium]MBE1423464.1 colicin import membrane protein [Desulfomicrobium macestii]SFL25383.1 Cell division and transport-associated protein TolA [Desulfomicrobium norvegicum]
MFNSLRHLSWVFSIVLHLIVLLGGAYVSTDTHIKLNLNKRMYEVDLVGPPNKGKPGAKSAPKKADEKEASPQKPVPKDAKAVKAPDEPKKPDKKAAPSETAKAIPSDTVNATKVAEAKPEEPKKPEPKKEAPKKEEPKKEEPKKTAKEEPKSEPKVEKKPTKEEILAQALGDATKVAKSSSSSGTEGAAKGNKSGSKDALADALADLGREVSGRGTRGDGTAEDGDGEGVSSGSLDQFYATQVVRAIRQNWRFPRLSNVVLATTVELKVNKGGEILGARMLNGSGRSDFDASVMRAIEDTKKLPPLPETLDATLVITFYNTEN